jgi:ABC-type uncharacterized transport system permease subunit
MIQTVICFLGFVLYLSSGLLLARRLAHANLGLAVSKSPALAVAAAALLAHAAVLGTSLSSAYGIHLTLTGALSLVGWSVAALFVTTAFAKPIENLGIAVLPLAGATLLLAWVWPGSPASTAHGALMASHIVISILAYALLCLAAAQSLLVLYQERALHAKHAAGIVRALPPMQTMETLLFQMLWVGFALLTLTLISGFFFSEEVFGKPLKFTHHIVLSLIGWFIYAVLLVGRWRFGWRGRTAVRFTLIGFALLVLAYFGTKFVLEVVLKRAT